MKEILVIFTGGTIGSRVLDGYISSDEEAPYLLLDWYEKEYPKEVHFSHRQPYTLLSENLTSKYWRLLQNCILEALKEKSYDGIIITHGSDTLQYSAAAMGFAFSGTRVPIFLVASNFVLEDKRANGFANFCAAVTCIKQGIEPDVYVPYRNADGRVYLHYGVNTEKHLSYEDDLYSTKGLYCAIIDGENIYKNQIPQRKAYEPTRLSVPDTSCKRVLRLASYPGMCYGCANWEAYGAVMIETYHSGTLCADADGMAQFLEEASCHNVPVFVAGAGNTLEYDSVKQWKDLGMHVLPVASPLNMYVKAWMLLAEGFEGDKLVEGMFCSMAGEFFITREKTDEE